MDEWLDVNIPAREVLVRRSLKSLAKELRADLKQARIGLLFNIARAVLVQMSDEITDALVLVEEYNGGKPSSFFWSSLVILSVPLAANIWMAIHFNKTRGGKAQVMGVLAAVLHVSPVIHGMKVWKGEGATEDEADPYLTFLAGRIVELIFESLPELVLQLHMVYRGKVSRTVMASLSMSVASAAFMMMDASVGQERGFMVSRHRQFFCRTRRP